MAVNQVVINGETVLDLTSDTVSPDKLLSGYTAHDASGAQITGTATASGSTETYATVYTGSGAPADTLGVNGDIYLDLG